MRLGVDSDVDRDYDEYLGGDDGELADYLSTAPDDVGARCRRTRSTPAGSATAASSGSARTRGRRTSSASTTPPDVELWPAVTEHIGCA